MATASSPPSHRPRPASHLLPSQCYQLSCDLASGGCNAAQTAAITAYALDIQNNITAVQAGFGSRDGYFITSCWQHEEVWERAGSARRPEPPAPPPPPSAVVPRPRLVRDRNRRSVRKFDVHQLLGRRRIPGRGAPCGRAVAERCQLRATGLHARGVLGVRGDYNGSAPAAPGGALNLRGGVTGSEEDRHPSK